MQIPVAVEGGDDALTGPRSRDRMPASLVDGLAAGGGVLVALGVLLVSLDLFADDTSQFACAALFGALIIAGYLGLALLPGPARAGSIAVIVLSVPAAYGWLLLPDTESFGDLRIFFALTIVTWALCWFVPLSRPRPIFVGVALILFWLWMIGEVAGLDSYSAAPIPSPPYLTPGDFDHTPVAAPALARPAQESFTLDDLDPTDPLYPLAEDCASGDLSACDQLWATSDSGSDFEDFGRTCGGTTPDAFGGSCLSAEDSPDDPFADDPFADEFDDDFNDSFDDSFVESPVDDKAWEIGAVSAAIAVVYLGALVLLDRRGLRGLATAFVLAGVLALSTAVSALGDASGQAFVGGLLALGAGLALGLIGHGSERRFTTWTGAVFAASGLLTIAFDIASFEEVASFDSESADVKIAGPGLLVMLCGAILIGIAVALALLLKPRPQLPAPGTPPGPADPTAPSEFAAPWTTVPNAPPATPAAPPWAPQPPGAGSEWAPPTAPPTTPPIDPGPTPSAWDPPEQ